MKISIDFGWIRTNKLKVWGRHVIPNDGRRLYYAFLIRNQIISWQVLLHAMTSPFFIINKLYTLLMKSLRDHSLIT